MEMESVDGAHAIVADGLTKRFGLRKAVDDISFKLPQGSFLVIFGPNGAGKSTLLRMLATLSRPTSGSVLLDGINVKEDPAAARMRLGMISHDHMLYPDLTAEENIIFFGELDGVADPKARALELLDAVGLKHSRKDRVRPFSRGMVQRTAIARALVNDPDIVLLDEPYAGLDPNAVAVFDSLIESIRQSRTFCMVSHDLDKGLGLASHVMVMRSGREVYSGLRDDVDEASFSALYKSTVGQGVA